MRPTIRLVLATLLALELAIAGCGGSNSHAPRQTAASDATRAPARASSSDLTGLEAQFISVVERVSPSVVQISTDSGLGSGVVYDGKGDIVTNHHVVAGSRRFEVTLANGRRHPAVLVGDFPPEDLAVIRLEGATPPAASLGDSSKLRVGQIAFAIGNPLGLRSSVTQGIVSSLGRTVSEGPGGGVVSSAVQTSAPINPGNSGGALADLDGRVVGIPTLAAANPEAGGAPAPGIGFAIPANTARRIADQLIESGHVTNSGRAYLGVRVASSLGATGVLIAAVEKGAAAAKAGLRAGDRIVAVDGKPTPSPEDLATVLAELRPGQSVPVVVLDPSGHRRSVTVRLGELPS
jgi:putative serine protease PepD